MGGRAACLERRRRGARTRARGSRDGRSMTPERLVLATRRSALALAQSRAFGRALAERFPGLVVDELQVVTTGDKVQNVPLAEVGGKGLFTKEIEEALVKGEADSAVHSFQDGPADLADALVIAA